MELTAWLEEMYALLDSELPEEDEPLLELELEPELEPDMEDSSLDSWDSRLDTAEDELPEDSASTAYSHRTQCERHGEMARIPSFEVAIVE